MYIKIKKLRGHSTIPTSGSEYAAGYDLYADLTESVKINPHKSEIIPTGIAINIPHGYFGGIFARSGLSAREGLRPCNCVGVIDADYTGEVCCVLHNDSNETRKINPGERIAQLVIIPCISAEFVEVDELDETARGTGGFGSTGK